MKDGLVGKVMNYSGEEFRKRKIRVGEELLVSKRVAHRNNNTSKGNLA